MGYAEHVAVQSRRIFTLQRYKYFLSKQTKFTKSRLNEPAFVLMASDISQSRIGGSRSRHRCEVCYPGRFVNSESDLVIQDVIEGNILQMADNMMSVLKSKYLVAPISYEGLHRKEPLEIPESALREAIYNAIVHKDYAGASIQMKVWNDKVELWNDGSLPEGYTVDTLFRKHTSKLRNKNIANAFYKAGFIESWGRGIDKIRTEIQSAGLPDPVFEETCGGMMVTINRGKTFSDIISDKQLVLNKLSERQRIIYDRLKKIGIPCVLNDGTNKSHIVKYINEIETAKSIALFIGVSERTVRRDLVVLQKEKLVIHTGTLNKGQWEISSFE